MDVTKDSPTRTRTREAGTGPAWDLEIYKALFRLPDDRSLPRAYRFTASDAKQLAGALTRCANRVQWRRLGQHRAGLVARLLGLYERCVRGFVARARIGNRWIVTALVDEEPAHVVELRLKRTRTVKEMKDPIEIKILRPDLIDRIQLNAIVGRGAANVSTRTPRAKRPAAPG